MLRLILSAGFEDEAFDQNAIHQNLIPSSAEMLQVSIDKHSFGLPSINGPRASPAAISPISTLTKKDKSKPKSSLLVSFVGNTLGSIDVEAPCMELRHLESEHETLQASSAQEEQLLCQRITLSQLCSFQHQ